MSSPEGEDPGWVGVPWAELGVLADPVSGVELPGAPDVSPDPLAPLSLLPGSADGSPEESVLSPVTSVPSPEPSVGPE